MNIKKFKVNPNNPRLIKDDKFKKLVKSLKDFPEMMAKRPLVCVTDTDGKLFPLGGNMRLKGLQELKFKDIPDEWFMLADDWTEEQRREFLIKDNVGSGEWSWDEIVTNWDAEQVTDWGLDIPDFPETHLEAEEDDFEVPELDQVETDIVLGDLFEIGPHRLMCGDSTDGDAVAKLMNGELADLVHADPPYGMGKEKDGVQNDNLYDDKLDAFQLLWISEFLKVSTERCSLYVWGNAEPLWALWFKAGLSKFDKLTLKNQIVWDKKNIAGMASPLLTMYPVVSEHCLFIQRGEQWSGNLNTEDYWDGFEPVRSYLAAEANKVKLKASDILDICGVGMYSHWFTKAQWTLIPENQYGKLQERYQAFETPWADLKKDFNKARKGFNQFVQSDRAYFDNAHESMTDVWDFKRVIGAERHNHATPKPIPLMERIIKSSSKPKQLVVEPFLGSGSTMVAAHQLNRKCYGMELTPKYCQVIIDRMLKLDPAIEIKRNGHRYKLEIN